MLGWSFTVEEVNTNEWLYYWEGGLFSDQWLKDAVKKEDAIQVKSSGGYPDVYLVKTKVVEEIKGIMPTTAKWIYVNVWDQS